MNTAHTGLIANMFQHQLLGFYPTAVHVWLTQDRMAMGQTFTQ